MSKFVTLWFWQKSRLTAEWFEVYSFTTDEYPHPYLSRQQNRPTLAEPWSYSSVDINNRLVVHTPSEHVPDAPPMWYLLIREYRESTQTQTLAGFDTNHYPDGTIVELSEIQRKGFQPSFMEQRVCAIRWGFGDPHIEQIHVAENYRRRRISVKIINVADVVNTAGNWGGFIYGGDQVTELGAKLGTAWSNSNRLMPQSVRFSG